MNEQSPNKISDYFHSFRDLPHAVQISRAISVITILLIFSLSIFGRYLVEHLSWLILIAPPLGVAVIALLLYLVSGSSKASTDDTSGSTPSLQSLSIATLGAIVFCGTISELLIVDPIERIHFVKYGLLSTAFFYSQIKESKMRRICIAIVSAILLGALDEGCQYLVPNRVFDLRDLGLNSVGALFGAILMYLSHLWQRYFAQRSRQENRT